jgi:hypothetical protein
LPSFELARARLGLSGRNFDYFFADVERNRRDYPWAGAEEVPDSDGILMLPTKDAFPDVPPLYVYYRVREIPNRIRFLGLSRAWSESDLPPA